MAGRRVVRNALLRRALELWLQSGAANGAASQGSVIVGAGGVYVAGNVGGDVVAGVKGG